MKTNVIKLNILHLNTVRINGRVEMQGVSLQAGEIPEPPVVTTYTLAANVSNGKVTATKNGTAISLPYVATEGDVIVLSVTPDEGYEFKGWLDGNKSNPRTVTMTGNVVLSASCVEIAKPTYTLSASVTNGKVSATLNGSAVNLPFTANEGDTIVVEVTPNDGYTFEGWNDGNTDNPRSITMNADVVLSAECSEVVQPPVGNYIQFEDKAVEAICVANWSSDGIGLTEEDAAKVATIGTTFKGNKEITSFDEFRYFTGVVNLQDYAFENCTNLQRIYISHIKSIGHAVFRGCSSLDMDVDMPYLTGSLGVMAFHNTKIRSFSAPLLSEIMGYSPSQSTFMDCINLTRVYAPSVVSVGSWVFCDDTALVDVIFSDSLQKVGEGTFWNCTALESYELGAAVTEINNYAFKNCSSFEQFICRATTPPTLGVNVLDGSYPIYVPDASLEAYKTATNWNQYSARIKPLSEYVKE